jgi:hypothetical protein
MGLAVHTEGGDGWPCRSCMLMYCRSTKNKSGEELKEEIRSYIQLNQNLAELKILYSSLHRQHSIKI